MATNDQSQNNNFRESLLYSFTKTESTFMEKILRLKHLHHHQQHSKLHGESFFRVFNLNQLIMFGIGNTIGAGIFALTGIAAKVAGASLFLSFIISGLIAATTALVYSEFSSRMPFSGSGYTFIYASFGELPAWIVGWNFCVRFGFSAGALFRGWTSYFVDLLITLGIPVPTYLYALKIGSYECSLITVVAVIVATYISTQGSKGSSKFNNTLTVIKLVTILFITFVAFFKFDINNFQPFTLPDRGFTGTLEGALILFFAYLGFDMISTLAEESKQPEKTLPASIMQTVFYCAFIYVLIAVSVTGMNPLQNFLPETAMATAFKESGLHWMGYIIYISAFFGISAAAFSNLLSQPRVLYAFSKDGLFFKIFSEIDQKKKVPIKGSWIVCFFICFVSFFLDLEALTKLISLVCLFNFSLINAGAVALRFREHNDDINLIQRSSDEIYAFIYVIFAFLSAFAFGYQWHYIIQGVLILIVIGLLTFLHTIKQQPVPENVFRCPLVPLIPCVGIFCNFILASQVEGIIWIYFFIYEAIGIIFYATYGYKNSKLNQKQSQWDQSTFKFSTILN